MGRILLHYVLPLVLPLTVYIIYINYRRNRARQTGGDVPAIEQTHIFISVIAGFLLMFAGLAWFAVSSGMGPGDGQYQSPHYEGGKIVPHGFK